MGISEKLSNSNYSTWKFEMKMMLYREDLYKYVEDPVPVENRQDNIWKSGNTKALATISLGCEKSQYSLIRNSNLAREAWQAIRNYHEKKTVYSKVSLIKKIVSKKLEENGDMEKHIQEFEDIFLK